MKQVLLFFHIFLIGFSQTTTTNYPITASNDNEFYSLVTPEKLIASEMLEFGSQQWWTSYDFPKDEIQEGYDDGKLILSLNYGNGVWALVMSGTSGYGSQQWWTSYDFPKEEI